ncbi:hypothetical protein D1AOALGA4SA_3377 [Olavius algarvensis Delta 1 endosymbiont]|nr:hypothetical protein D1AOALGA4SA_3377 [Olavius algarvensis Delta 1 endosymbiont]
MRIFTFMRPLYRVVLRHARLYIRTRKIAVTQFIGRCFQQYQFQTRLTMLVEQTAR